FVGDIKQSIYRFRGADPLVFSRLTKDPDFTVIPLNRNFRSCGQVIDSVNGIFTGTMTEELGDVDYNESCALVRGTAFDTDDDMNRTELMTFSCGGAEASRVCEAAYIADRIKCMVRDKFPVTQKNGVKRPCRYSDFAVLMGRYSSNIHIYKDAFDKAGVPYDAKDSGGYTDNAEIVHALSLLRVIDDPYRDTDLAAVLMLPPYMLDEKEMAAIKLAGGKNSSLWTGLGKRAATDPRAKKIFDEINAFRRFADENSAERLIRKICDESLLIPASEASPDGERRSTNLRRLIFCAENFTGGVSASLYDFIRYMENIRKSRISLTQAKGGSEDAVRIMTIHGSKGLEFPVCFVSNLSSRQDSDSSEIICDPVYGIGMKINDREKLLKIDTGTYNMVSEENARLDMSEEMRLLYVAATRAREKLIFTAPLSARGAPDMHYGWILGSGAVKSGLISVRNYESYQSAENEEKTDASEHEVRLPEFTEYRYRRYSEIPAKVTATEIGVRDPGERSGTSDRIDRFLRVPTFLGTQATARLTGKKRGDAYHKVMELLDFRAGVNDVPRILDSLRDSGKISEAERLSVSDDDIAAFLE
ncbi:MAG: UvrD-helicase domain-containing protein, partial [Ruminiclostridium sp.]|nr:UvrD-helicase domain-containing protein [Ruminiclostridium sp.]